MVRRLYPTSSLGIRGERRRHPMELHTIGIDLGKTVFHLVGLNPCGEVVVRKKFSRKQLLHFTANLKVKLISMEAYGGSHFLGRGIALLGPIPRPSSQIKGRSGGRTFPIGSGSARDRNQRFGGRQHLSDFDGRNACCPEW